MNSKSLTDCLILGVLIFVSGTFLASCGEEQSVSDFEFINQNLQGQIEGIPWEFAVGRAQLLPANNVFLSLEMIGNEVLDPCQPFPAEVAKIFFDLPNQPGLYNLKVALQNPGLSQTITFFVPVENENYVAFEGAVEIFALDTLNMTLPGRMDARVNDGIFANGNFSLSYCL